MSTGQRYGVSYCQSLACDLESLPKEEVYRRVEEYTSEELKKSNMCVAEMKVPDDVSALLRCSRCKGVYYKTPEGQKENWKVHKVTCKKPDIVMVSSLNLTQTWIKIRDQLINGVIDEHFGLLLQHFRDQWDDLPNTPNHEDYHEIEAEMHGTCRNLIFMQDSSRINKFHEMMWAAPGVADFFCCREDLVNSTIRRQRVLFPLGLPSAEGIKTVLVGHPNTQEITRDLMMQESAYMSSGIFKFCYLHFNLLLSFALQAKLSRDSVFDGFGTLRSGPIAEAAMKRCLELWLNESARLSCGDAMAPAFSFAITYIKERSSRAGPCELAPGLPCDGVLKACLQEVLEHGHASLHAINLIVMIDLLVISMGRDPWSTMSIERRADVAIILADAISCSNGELVDSLGPNGKTTVWELKLDSILDHVCSKTDAGLRMQVWRTAACGSDLCAIGRLDNGRAFFRYMLMVYDMPALLASDKAALCTEENITKQELCKKAYKEFDDNLVKIELCKQAIKWAGSPWPRYATAEQMPSANDKLESYRRVMEPERFKAFEKIYSVTSSQGAGSKKRTGKAQQEDASFYSGVNLYSSPEQTKIASALADEIAASLWEEADAAEVGKPTITKSTSSKPKRRTGKR